MTKTRAELLSGDLNVPGLEVAIQKDKNSKFFALRGFVGSTQDKLQTAQSLVNKAQSLAEPWKVSKQIISDLLAPARELVNLLDALSDLHPAIKVVAGVVKIVVKLELDRHDNDKNIAVVFFTMSSLLFLLSGLDPVFNEDSRLSSLLNDHLKTMCGTINEFGNFCDVYYRHLSSFVKTIRSGKYRDQLAGFAKSFTDQKTELNLLLTSQSTLQIIDMSTDVKKVLTLLDAKSAKEQKAEEVLNSLGGLDVVLQNDKLLGELAKKLGEEYNTSMRRIVRMDMEEVLSANESLFSMKVERASQQIQAAVENSTKTILSKLDAGPHEFIEDPDIRLVWQDMHASTSAKARVFLDAAFHHFSRQFLLHELKENDPHPDKWTLSFLSKVIFYPSIGDAIDGDSSGFVSVHEVNDFLNSRPSGWSVPKWLAFWAAGPYKTDVQYQSKIERLRTALQAAVENVLPVNVKRVKYLVNGISGQLDLITVYEGVLDYYGESQESDDAYAELEKLRVEWSDKQLSQMKGNLERSQYRLRDAESVMLIVETRRIEQAVLCLIYLLLQRHLKIVKLAGEKLISRAEFEDMRASWDYFFEAFDTRSSQLAEVWRQQRLNIDTQLECYSGGLFETWEKRKRDAESSSSDEYDSDESGLFSDDDTYAEDNDGDAEGDDVEGDEGDNDADEGDRTFEPKTPIEEPGAAQRGTRPAENLLLYPVPTEPEDDEGLTTDEDSEWETGAQKRKKAEAALLGRVDKMESKLTVIEDLLRQLLSAQGVAKGPNSDHGESNKTGKAGESNETHDIDESGESPHEVDGATHDSDEANESAHETDEANESNSDDDY